MSLNFSYIFQLGTDEVLQSVGATCPKLVYLKFQPRIQVNNTGHYERICVTEKGLLALLNCQELKTIKVGIKLKYPGTCRRVTSESIIAGLKACFNIFILPGKRQGTLALLGFITACHRQGTSASTLFYTPCCIQKLMTFFCF